MKDHTKSTTRLKLLGQQLELAQLDAPSRKQAAAVLEVLAGLRTPQQAATALGLSLPAYFHTETRALRGLILACCTQAPGRQPTLAPQLRQAQAKIAELQRQVGRYQALLRTAQRHVGLAPAAEAKSDPGTRRKAKKPSVRAIRAIQALNQVAVVPAPGAPPALPATAGTASAATSGLAPG